MKEVLKWEFHPPTHSSHPAIQSPKVQSPKVQKFKSSKSKIQSPKSKSPKSKVETSAVFFRSGCGRNCFRPSLGHKTRKCGLCHGLGKFDFSRRPSMQALFFSEMGVGTNVFGQVVDTRQKNEVPAMRSELLTCPGKLRCLPSFFRKCLCGQIFSHRPLTQDWKVGP